MAKQSSDSKTSGQLPTLPEQSSSLDYEVLCKHLEEKMIHRTELLQGKIKDLSDLLQNIHQGIFSIAGKELLIQDEYSRYLEDLLETKRISNTPILETLFAGADLSPNELDPIQKALKSSIGESSDVWRENERWLPTQLRKVMADSSIKILELHWSPVTNDNDQLEKVVVAVREVMEPRKE